MLLPEDDAAAFSPEELRRMVGELLGEVGSGARLGVPGAPLIPPLPDLIRARATP